MACFRQLLRDCGIGDVKSDPGEVELLGSTSQHRVLIFCQTRQMLDIIQDQLFVSHMPSVSFMRLDGGTDPMKRHDIVQTFNGDPSIDVLLLTTSVGGLGLTLTGADTVIFVDHDWNPSKDMQAMDRAHRLGQKKVVNVYRLITRDTLEEKIMRWVCDETGWRGHVFADMLERCYPAPPSLQRFKQNMANTVISQQNQGLETMNTDQVLDLFAGPSRSGPAKPIKDGPMSKNDILAG
jgi:TATA-binding protein-associated factor